MKLDLDKVKTSIKRFFSNPNTLTFVLVIGLIVVIYLVYSYMINRAIAPVTIPYCTNEIKTLNEIKSDSIGSIEMSGNFVSFNGSNLLQNRRNIAEKYVAQGYFIPKNSFFYAEAVTDSAIAEKTLLANANQNDTVYELKTDFHKTYGCSIMSGNYIDLYTKIKVVDEASGESKIWFTWFAKSIQVVKVFNDKGLDVFTESDGEKMNPKSLVFIVPTQLKDLLVVAEHLRVNGGEIEIIPVPRNAGYTENPPEFDINTSVKAFIEEGWSTVGGDSRNY